MYTPHAFRSQLFCYTSVKTSYPYVRTPKPGISIRDVFSSENKDGEAGGCSHASMGVGDKWFKSKNPSQKK